MGLAAYYKSQAWGALSPATQRQRRNVFKHIEAEHGATKLVQWTRREIVAGRDNRADRPAAAGMFLKAMRGLFQWLLDAEHIGSDPTQGVRMVETRTDGFEAWTIDDLTAYRADGRLALASVLRSRSSLQADSAAATPFESGVSIFAKESFDS